MSLNKIVIFGLLTFLLPLIVSAQRIDAKLISINYYNSEGYCDKNSPILVKICFDVRYSTPQELTYVIVDKQGITYSNKIQEYDQNGHIYYSFCSQKGEISDFKLYFRNNEGIKSKVFEIFAIPNVE